MFTLIRKIAVVLTREEKRGMGLLLLLDLVISIADIAFLALLLLIVQVYTGATGPGPVNFPFCWLAGPVSIRSC